MPSVNQLIADFLEYLEKEHSRATLTRSNYEFYLKRFARWTHNPKPKNITADMVQGYRRRLSRYRNQQSGKLLSAKTQNYHLIALRSFLKYLAKRNLASLAPEKIELAAQPAKKVDFLGRSDLLRLLAAPFSLPAPEIIQLRNCAILELLFSTGLRVGELTKLTRKQINLQHNEFTVLGKGGKVRVVFLSGTARDALRRYLDKCGDSSEALFLAHDRAQKGKNRGTRQEANLTPRSVQRVISTCARAAGITQAVTPHTLRHSFAAHVLTNGADIHRVQIMLGHSSVATMQMYAHVAKTTNRTTKK